MLADLTQCDITGTVDLEDSGAVANACASLLAARYGARAIDRGLLLAAFRDVHDAFWGRNPDYLPCDTPYHDLRHALDTALLTARLVDGYEAQGGCRKGPALAPEVAMLAVLLALMHDTGFLRRTDEAAGPGARLLAEHEARSVRFAQRYLAQTRLAARAAQAVVIESTSFAHGAGSAAQGLPTQLLAVAQLLGTADLLAQFADRDYLEKCYYHLYAEFVVAGLARPAGGCAAAAAYTYDSPQDLLRRTPAFFAEVVRPRLDGDLAGRYACLTDHFGGSDPYMASVAQNLRHLEALLATENFAALRRRPRPLLPDSPPAAP